MPINYWTSEEDKLLKELYQTEMTAADIAKRFGRTTEAIMKRASKLTTDEVIYMEENETAYTCRSCKHCLITKTETGQDIHKCVINNEILHTLHPCEVWEEKSNK